MTEHLRIMFVCSGNICRSPMAQAIAEQLLDDRGIPAVVISAGTLGIVGREPAVGARRALAELDLELSGERSQGVSPAMAKHADYLPVMEPEHEEYLLEHVADAGPKIVRLWEYADGDLSGIDDPVGEDLETFRQTRDLLYRCIERWLDELAESSEHSKEVDDVGTQ